MRQRGRWIARNAMVVAAMAWAGVAAPPAGAASVPLGTAVWWGCVEPSGYIGPIALSCPLAFDARYPATLTSSGFGVMVPENEMKMLWLEPGAGKFDFSVADRFVAYAAAHGMHVRGHALISGNDIPPWMLNPLRKLAWTRTTLLAALKHHITTVMRHYRDQFPGVIAEWDVVNEAFDGAGNLRPNLFAKIIGPDYIEQALRFAREADPEALLFFNEFDADGLNARQAAVLRMARDFRERGVPLDGIGMQMHLGLVSAVPPAEQRVAVMRSYAQLGLRVEITELDAGVRRDLDFGARPDLFGQVARECAEQPACTGMTVWGVADPLSWRGLQAGALLFDDHYQPKPALAEVRWALDEASRRNWTSRSTHRRAPSYRRRAAQRWRSSSRAASRTRPRRASTSTR